MGTSPFAHLPCHAIYCVVNRSRPGKGRCDHATILLKLSVTATAPTTLDTTAVYGGDTLAMVLDRAASGSGSPTAPTISQFVFGADTYLVLDSTADPTWVGSNLAIKLSGAPTLTLADFSFA